MKVSIDQVINRAKMRLSIMDTTIHDAVLEKLINEAATHHLNTLSSTIISCCEVTIDDCYKAKLPEYAVEDGIICYSFPDATGCTGCCADCMNDRNPGYQCSCPTWFVANRDILTNFCGAGANAGVSANFFDIQGGYIVFPSTVTQSSVKIWYRAYNVDSDGLAVLNEKQERALSAYAAWHFAIMHFRRYPRDVREGWKREWIAQKNWLKGDANQSDARLHKPELSSIVNAILINPMMVASRNV